jgi:hypothetical protein
MASMIVDDVPRSASAADAAAAVTSIEMVLAALEPGAAQPNGGPAAAAVDAQSKSLGTDSLLRPVSSRAARRPTCCPPPQSPDPSRPKGSFAPRVVGRGAPLRHVRRQRKSCSRHGCCNCRCRHRSARWVGRDAARTSTCELSMGLLLSPPPATSIFHLRHAVPAPPSLTLPICARPGAAAGSKPPPLPFSTPNHRNKGFERPTLLVQHCPSPTEPRPFHLRHAAVEDRLGQPAGPGCRGRWHSRSSGSAGMVHLLRLSRSAAIAVERIDDCSTVHGKLFFIIYHVPWSGCRGRRRSRSSGSAEWCWCLPLFHPGRRLLSRLL